MTVEEFTALLENTMRKAATAAGGMDQLTACLSRPSTQLSELYGPLTNKILKERAQKKAQDLYDQYSGDDKFLAAVQQLSDRIAAVPLDATNGAVSSMGALCHLKDNFGSSLGRVLAGVKEPPNKIEGVLLAVADMSITAGLSFIPVAGPFLVPLSQGIGSALSTLATGAMTGAAIGLGDNSLLFVGGNADMKAQQKTTINSDAARQDRADAAVNTGKAVGSGIAGAMAVADPKGTFAKLAAQKGVASLIVTGLKIAIRKNDDKILKMADSTDKSFAKLIGGTTFSQNQVAASCINSLGRLNIEMPRSLAADPNRTEKYLREEATLETFKTMTADMFRDFYSMLVKIMNSGLIGSFEEPIARLRTPAFHTKHQKIALLILGYFYSKDWDDSRATQRASDISRHEADLDRSEQAHLRQSRNLEVALRSTGMRTWDHFYGGDITRDPELLKKFDVIERIQNDMRTTEGDIQRNKQMLGLLRTKTGLSTLPVDQLGTSARTALDVARSMTSKRGVLIKNFGALDDLQKLPTFVAKAENYFLALKSALTADIETAMVKGNNGFLSDRDFEQMWKLFIGSQLIVNHALNDSKIKIQSSSVRKFFRNIKPTTDATEIPDYYVKLIEDAEFIQRYRGDWLGQVTVEKKRDLAGTGKMRWSFSPSNTERAMLITFCTVVAFTLDVGKISLGFYSWQETVKDLRKVCMTISSTAWA